MRIGKLAVFAAIFVASWLVAALLWSLVSGKPFRILPAEDVGTMLILTAGGSIGLLLGYLRNRFSAARDG